MKRIIFLTATILLTLYAGAQDIVLPNKPSTLINSRPGYLTFNELAGGIGLGNTSVPFSK